MLECVDMTQTWSEDVHRRVASAIKKARAGRSAQWLADQTEQLGYPISRSAIANYESGRKKTLDLVELIAIAAALHVPPVVLLYPELPTGLVELLPDITVTSWDAVAWFSGEELLPGDTEHYVVTRESKLIHAVRDYQAQLPLVGELHRLTMNYLHEGNPDGRPIRPNDPTMLGLTERMEALRGEIRRLTELIHEYGGVTEDV